MTQITDIIQQEKEHLKEVKAEKAKNRILIKISADDFKELFLIQVNKIIASRNINREFEITDQNKELINQIFYYCTGNYKYFNGSIEKGLFIVGKNGVGKTLILKGFCEVIKLIGNKIFYQVHSKKLQSEIRQNGTENFEKRPMFIDDIGKESKEVNDYGTKILPIADLIALRYDNGALTFASCNYNIDTLTEFYGITTTDRFKEMFNVIELSGESFRK